LFTELDVAETDSSNNVISAPITIMCEGGQLKRHQSFEVATALNNEGK